MRASRAAAVSAVLATMLAGAACYKPNIKSGGLACGPGNACPDGLLCDVTRSPAVCVSGGLGGASGTGAGGKGGVGGKGGSGTGGQIATGGQSGAGGGGTGGAACLPDVSGCTSTYVDGGACDPVCNVGCSSCDEKCSVNGSGNMTCNPPSGTGAGFMQPCQISQRTADVQTQTDNCAPGQVCLQQTTCGVLCYQFCRTNADCASQNCGRDLGNGLKVCDVATTPCDPTLMASPCSASSIQTRCYISGQTGLTLCDCPNYKQLGTIGNSCTHSRDCFAGLVCYNKTGTVGGSQCFRACRLPTDGGAPDAGASTCAGGAANCKPMLLPSNGTFSAVWGYCEE